MDRLQQALVDTEQQILAMERRYDHIVEAEHAKREQIIRAISAASTTCEVCGGPIGQERLEARPYARTCVTCARRA